MRRVLGCSVSEALIEQWSRLLVCESAPFFLPDDLDLPPETLILSRKDFLQSGFELSYRDSYATYRISQAAHGVAFLTPEIFDSLPVDTQKALLAAQCELKRGQVYVWADVAPFFAAHLPQAQSRCVDVDGITHLVLDTWLWDLLTDEQRAQWLIEYITEDNPPACLSASVGCPARIARLAGTFATRSGPNCFSTTLAAITQDEAIATIIADFWLHQEPFFEGLAQMGYVAVNRAIDGDLQDAVLLWQDANGIAQHACCVFEAGYVINKNSQAWFSPRQILRLETVLDYWADEPFEVMVYRK